MFSLVFAVTSAVAYGVSDFVGGVASRHARSLRVVLVSYPVSAFIIGVAAPFFAGTPTTMSMLWGMASGAVMALAMWWFYGALAEGTMSVVSPITAVLVSGIPVITGVMLGERPSVMAWVGIVLAIVAVLLVSREHSDAAADRRRFTRRVALLTFGAGLCFALSFIFTDQIEAGTGLWPLLAARCTATVIVVIMCSVRRDLRLISGRPLVLALTVGVLDVIANTTMLFAFQSGALSIGSAVIALYPAVTVLLAVLVLHERVTGWQVAGLALTAVAILLVTLSQ